MAIEKDIRIIKFGFLINFIKASIIQKKPFRIIQYLQVIN